MVEQGYGRNAMDQQSDSLEEIKGYRIKIAGRHVQVTEGMKQHAIAKIEKIERFTDRIIDVTVTMDIQKLEQRADIVLRCGHMVIRASASSLDMYQSIDKAVQKIQRRLGKFKSRLQDHQASNLSMIDMRVNVLQRHDQEDLEVFNDEIEEETAKKLEKEYEPHSVVSTETIPMKTLTQDEAIMKMELSEDRFMVYRSEEDQMVRVIYRRQDGNYGIIEVQ